MGAKIRGAGTDTIVIQGVERLRGASYDVLPDRIETGTYLVAGAITGGRVRVEGTRPDHLDAVLAKLREAGAHDRASAMTGSSSTCAAGARARWTSAPRRIRRSRPTCRRSSPRSTPSPKASATITETIFENRFMHMLEMRRLGADIRIEGNTRSSAACRS